MSFLNPYKACGPDQICPRLLKEDTEIIASPLADLFNKSLSDGVLPLDWVSANFTSVFTKREKQLPSPISLACIVRSNIPMFADDDVTLYTAVSSIDNRRLCVKLV